MEQKNEMYQEYKSKKKLRNYKEMERQIREKCTNKARRIRINVEIENQKLFYKVIKCYR